MDAATHIQSQIAAHEQQRQSDRKQLRELPISERSRLIKAACQAALAINRSRVTSNLPPVEPTPWPESTWTLLRKYAPNGRAADAAE